MACFAKGVARVRDDYATGCRDPETHEKSTNSHCAQAWSPAAVSLVCHIARDSPNALHHALHVRVSCVPGDEKGESGEGGGQEGGGGESLDLGRRSARLQAASRGEAGACEEDVPGTVEQNLVQQVQVVGASAVLVQHTDVVPGAGEVEQGNHDDQSHDWSQDPVSFGGEREVELVAYDALHRSWPSL